MVDNMVFLQGMDILAKTFTSLNLSPSSFGAWKALLDDLSDHVFLKAVETICLETERLYPGTNIVALIKSAARDVRRTTGFTFSQHELRQREWVLNELAAGRGYGDPTLAERMKKGRRDFSWRDV